MDQIGDMISSDIAMSAKVLQLVNSSFFGLAQHVSCPKHAVALLGLNVIRPLVLLAGAYSQCDNPDLDGYSLEKSIQHSLSVATLARKIAAVKAAVAFHKDHLSDPLEVLRRLGGREVAAMAGAILACRVEKIPVLIDGYVATAAAAILKAANPAALDHCLIGHVSGEPGHLKAIEKLGKTPLLALGMRLGEGTGAALAAGIVKAAAACQSGMATFEAAGVSNKTDG